MTIRTGLIILIVLATVSCSTATSTSPPVPASPAQPLASEAIGLQKTSYSPGDLRGAGGSIWL